MYNLTQFVLKFLISFLLVFFFVCFYCLFTPAKIFLKFLKIFKILNTSYVHMSIYIYTIIFLASLDNDRSTVETSYFAVDFYR